MRYMNRETSATMVVGNEILQQERNVKIMRNGNSRKKSEEDLIVEDTQPAVITNEILNPFVHRLELDTTYDKLKVSSSARVRAFFSIKVPGYF